MDHLLNLSTAAKLAGVSRRTIQSRIQAGELEAFEGHVRMSALSQVYPDIESKTDRVLERMSRIQDNAMFKVNADSDERLLANQAHRLQIELTNTIAELDSYKALTMELQERLFVMKEGCDRKEKQMLQALIHWMSTQLKQRV